jgi:hypothetical protein
MNESTDQTTELYELAHAQCDGELTVAQTAQLEQLVAGNAELRRKYVLYMHVHAAAELGERGAGDNDECRMMNDELPESTSGEWRGEREEPSIQQSPFIIQPSLSSPLSPLPAFFGGVLFSYLTAAILLGTALVIAWAWKLPDYAEIARQPQAPVAKPQRERDAKMEFVGRITGMVDCQWSDPHTAVPGPVAVPLGRKYALASGLLEITYDTGAKVILQGPVTYKVESASGGYLSVGKLTARVEKGEAVRSTEYEVRSKEEGSNVEKQKSGVSDSESRIANPLLTTHHSPLFTITTPTATVTDLGTEFGVEVSEKGATTSRVFQGVVIIRPVDDARKSTEDAIELREGQVARVESGDPRPIAVLDSAAGRMNFVRAMPKRIVKSLDLVDVVAGGDGFSGGRRRGVDPATGSISERAPSNYLPTIASDNLYHRVEGIGFVDGVFIPNGAAGPVQVDSVGHTFDDFRKTDNLTYGHLWAGGPIALANAPDALRTNLGGNDDYASPGHGLLLVHANSGITFDLDAIRKATDGKIVRFRATGGNAATFADTSTLNADLWVLVDGRLRFVRGEEAGRGGPVYVSVPLQEKDRFLTLAFTDGGDGCGWDWTMFADPRLEMVLTEPSRDSDSQAEHERQR